LIPNFRKFGHDLFVLGFKRWGRWCVLFLEHHKRERMNQEEGGRKKTNKPTKENQEQKQFIKAKVVICMYAT
jgi:hypothetical protein